MFRFVSDFELRNSDFHSGAVLAQPKADPSSGGVLARKSFLKRSVEHFIGTKLISDFDLKTEETV